MKETVEDFEAENLNFHLRPHLDTFSMKGWRIGTESIGRLIVA
jgi:hypothetical protein